MRNQLLRDADWAGMAHSIEVRTPWVDAELWKTVVPILLNRPLGEKKLKILSAVIGKIFFPEIMHRSKTGFGVPMASWLRDRKDEINFSQTALRADTASHWSRQWACRVYEHFSGQSAFHNSQRAQIH